SVPSVSSVVRYGRAEGLALGGGLAIRAGPARIDVLTGYAFAAEKARGRVELTLPAYRLRPRVAVYGGEIRDVGPGPAGPNVVNSISAAFGSDETDPFYAAGASLDVRLAPVAGGLTGGVLVERQSAARPVVDDAPLADRRFRPVPPAREGTRASAILRLVPAAGLETGWRIRFGGSVEAGAWREDAFVEGNVQVEASRLSAALDTKVSLRAAAG